MQNIGNSMEYTESEDISQKEFLRQQNALLESLKYASYIQQALLPSAQDFSRTFPQHFIFHQPRDIVSGDFYYIKRVKNKTIVAAADCTGHGVPGAFMSILGITFLNEIIYNMPDPKAASILNQLRERIMKALCQTGDDDEQKDGLDMALCIISEETGNLNFAGAFNPVYIVRDHVLNEIPGDKMPVGIAPDEEKPFENQYFDLQNDDLIYLFTDGFVDQFGGPHGKKYKYQPFRNLILKTSSLPFHQQIIALSDAFNAWKGNHKQLDDVLVVGCRYHSR